MICTNTYTKQHTQSEFYVCGTLWEQHHLQQQANEAAEFTTIHINNIAIKIIDTFKYLGCPLSATSIDILAVNYNLKKSKKPVVVIGSYLKERMGEQENKFQLF
jgi:hypothetical protein